MHAHRVPNWLEQRASDRADHPALIAGGETIAYAELARRASAFGAALRQRGVQRGDRVGLLLPNGTDFAVAMHALMRLGAVLVPLDRRLADAELRARMEDARIALVVHDRADAGREPVRTARHRGWAAIRVEDLVEAVPSPPPSPASIAGEGAGGAAHVIVYTSGSGGRAKGVVLTYENHFWSAVGSACNLGVDPDDRWLACLPFCHVGGLSILLRSVIYGTTAVIHDGFDAQRVNRAIDDDRVTIVSVVATMLQRMLDARGGRPYPPWLRCVLLGGSPAPHTLLEACAARGLPVVQTYGMTEAASQIATLAPRDARRNLGSAGTPLLGTEIRIVNARGRAVPPGGIGEIQVRGPTVTPGYWSGGWEPDTRPASRPEAERSPFLEDSEKGIRPISQPEWGRIPFPGDGWFATGDLGRLDDEGFLYVVGRRDDLIVSGGENVHPAEVEAVLHAHPAVAEACVAGIPDPQWGSTIAAWVRLRPGASVTEADLRAHVRASLAAFKVPRRVTLVDDFPRTASGKILRRALPALGPSPPPERARVR